MLMYKNEWRRASQLVKKIFTSVAHSVHWYGISHEDEMGLFGLLESCLRDVNLSFACEEGVS